MNSGDLPHYLLDTNIISEIVKFAPDFKVIKKIGEHSSDMAISVLTWHELVYGLERLPEGLRKKELSKYVYDDVEQSFPIINFTKKAAEIHAKIRSAIEESGYNLPYADTQIAATAIAEDMILVTRNSRHFSEIEEKFSLKLESWFEDNH